ncbi:hypothetical protein [Brachyspira sp.]|uniref:hypothetical protein n=1 Tax=Brachyspira sp. TaxID=1977261 RepID=UPI003D7C6C39
MKNLIMFFVLVMVMVFSNYEVSYSQEVETGNFYFLVGTEGNERAIMYLYIFGDGAYGSYYTESQSITDTYGEDGGFGGSFDGKNLKLGYGGEWDSDKGEYVNQKYITGTLSGDIVFRGKHNSKNVNLSLANAPINSARIRKQVKYYESPSGYYYDYYITEFIFNSRTLDTLYSSRLSSWSDIVYLDENIIILEGIYGLGGRYAGSLYNVYSINTGKKIEMKDFISNLNDRNLLALLRKKVLEYASNNDNNYNYNDETYYSFDNDLYSFYITTKGITFYMYDEGLYNEPYSIDIDFTFEELKPYIKRGSPLDYLFN